MSRRPKKSFVRRTARRRDMPRMPAAQHKASTGVTPRKGTCGCGIYAHRRLSSAAWDISLPEKSMVPEVGFTDPQSDPSNVVLPAPLCPRTPVSVPLGNEKLTSRSAHTSEENLPNRLFKSRTDKLQYCSILCSAPRTVVPVHLSGYSLGYGESRHEPRSHPRK